MFWLFFFLRACKVACVTKRGDDPNLVVNPKQMSLFHNKSIKENGFISKVYTFFSNKLIILSVWSWVI